MLLLTFCSFPTAFGLHFPKRQSKSFVAASCHSTPRLLGGFLFFKFVSSLVFFFLFG
jgi:hypothetical protein